MYFKYILSCICIWNFANLKCFDMPNIFRHISQPFYSFILQMKTLWICLSEATKMCHLKIKILLGRGHCPSPSREGDTRSAPPSAPRFTCLSSSPSLFSRSTIRSSSRMSGNGPAAKKDCCRHTYQLNQAARFITGYTTLTDGCPQWVKPFNLQRLRASNYGGVDTWQIMGIGGNMLQMHSQPEVIMAT